MLVVSAEKTVPPIPTSKSFLTVKKSIFNLPSTKISSLNVATPTKVDIPPTNKFSLICTFLNVTFPSPKKVLIKLNT